MFFEKNQNLLIATGGVALLWIILYYVFVSPNWDAQKSAEETARLKRKEWEDTAAALKEKKDATDKKRSNGFLTRKEAEKELEENSKQTLVRMKELDKIEFGTHETLKPFSLAAAGAGGDVQNLLNEKSKQAVLRTKAIMPKEKVPDDLFVKGGGEASVPLSLLRLALIDRFLTACKDVKDVNTKECRIEQIVQVDYYPPVAIPIPVADEKGKAKDDEDDGEVKKKPKKGDKSEDKPEQLDRLIQIPMKVLVRGPERYINQLLLQLAQPTPARQEGEDRHGYFSIRGFHVTTRETLPNSVEMCVAVSALIRESEIKALKVSVKTDSRGGGNDPAPF